MTDRADDRPDLSVQARLAPRVALLLACAMTVPVGGMLLVPTDPLGLGGGFAWAAALPILFAAWHGSAWGAACAALLAAALFALSPQYPREGDALLGLAIGTMVMCLLIGEIAAGYRRRSRRAEALSHEYQRRLRHFATDYHVLQVSHRQLEEVLATEHTSLREALEDVRRALLSSGDAGNSAAEILAVLGRFCSIQSAGFHRVRDTGRPERRPLATLGAPAALLLDDPMLRRALDERSMLSVSSLDEPAARERSRLLAVVPVTDLGGRLHGVIAVHEMHFLALQQDNLNRIALLARYAGDLIGSSDIRGISPRDRFFDELDRALLLAREHELPGALLRFGHPAGGPERRGSARLGDGLRERVASWLIDNKRALDSHWQPRVDSGVTLVLLLPLLGPAERALFLERTASAVRERFGAELSSIFPDIETLQIAANHTREDCLGFVHAIASTGDDDDTRTLGARKHHHG